MADLLKTWLQARLGVIMDLCPETFGRYTSDGTLLAQILHNYDIISSNQLSTILRTHDPALSRVNLKTLRIWLKLINVTLSNEYIRDISEGKGATALQLFYKVYLSLEGKDRLHFMALQKQREKLAPAFGRFDVTKVCEEPPPYQPPEHPLSKPLIEFADTILWHRNKFWDIVRACKESRRLFEIEYPIVKPVECFVPKDVVDETQKESERLDEFALKHPARRTKRRDSTTLVECCPRKRSLDVSFVEKPAVVEEYLDFLKQRSERALKFQDPKLKTQTTMMADAWEKLLRQEDKSFDEALGLHVLDQSRYEKQIMRKLCEVRDLRNRVVENRRIVDTMLLKIRENDQRQQHGREVEEMAAEARDVEMERRRMRELHRRICEKKVQKLKEICHGICTAIARDLVDIVVKIAEYSRADDGRMPRAVRNDCRTLFLKNQPIFELIEYSNLLEIEDAEEEEEEDTGNKVKAKESRLSEGTKPEITVEGKRKLELLRLERDRQSVLAEADFENYRDLAPPWDEFVPTREGGEEEDEADEAFRLGRVVLGHVVHRLLEVLYKRPAEITASPAPSVKFAALLLGITSTELLEELRRLLKRRDVHLLRMEDAINRCLDRYKEEMTDVEYIDLNVISATARDIERSQAEDKANGPRKSRRVKMTEPTSTKNKLIAQRQDAVEEKQTQTPRRIPYDDLHPTLSDAAYIGKCTYEFLALGQPIPNELSTKILIEYLKELRNVEGWVLINYPDTYERMAMLEEALAGRRVSTGRNEVLDLADINVEDIDPPSPRILFETDEVDTFAICGQSRLLPNQISQGKDRPTSPTTFLTRYIKAMPKPKTLGDEDESCIPLPDDATSMDEHYADRDIAFGVYYNVLDLPVMKQLAELITGDRLIERIFSSEEETPETQERKPSVDPKGAATVKRWVPKPKWEELQRREKEDGEIVSRDSRTETEAQLAPSPVRPGENGWQWVDLPQPPLLLETLATLWESMEESYVDNLKEILSLKRIHTLAIIPYEKLVLRNLTEFIDRPDNRQNLLQDFHAAFNEVDEDLRELIDMKCELHCRVIDFRTELWELCDARRHEAEEERKRNLRNQWIPSEAAVLVNVYIEILQAEIDRFVDTMQLLQDYYTSMSQKPLRESQFAKILLDRVRLDLRGVSNSETLYEPVDDKERKTATRTKADSIQVFLGSANIEHFKTDIESLLTDVLRSFDPERNVIYDVIKDAIRRVQSTVDSVSSTITETLKREEKTAVPYTDSSNKGAGDVSPNSTSTELTRRSRDLVNEWRHAAQFEIRRISQHLDTLDAAARSDAAFLLETMTRAFHRMHDYIVERYKREIDSIDNMANVFRFAIEEAKPIQQLMSFEGDRFVIRPNVLMFLDEPEPHVLLQEAPSPLRFRVIQLARLVDIFQRVAPSGMISERGLVYILQDLVSCGEEDCYPATVPCGWRQLRAPDIEDLVKGLFDDCEYIEWREFVLYALDLPVPSHQDILRTRAAFRRQDPELLEVISNYRYRLTSLWFLDGVEAPADFFHPLLFEDHEAFLDEEDDCDGCEGIMDAILREAARLDAAVDSGFKNDFIESSVDNFGDTVRLLLAKELLCHMFSTDRNKVNYTALLLAFCKDEDPREGLGKAFTIAMGAKVCSDTEEGERYVRGLIKRRARQVSSREETVEIARGIVSCLVDGISKSAVVLGKRRSSEQEVLSKRRVVIQQLDGNDEMNPTSLSPVEVTPDHPMEDASVINNGSLFAGEVLSLEDYEIQRDDRIIYWLPRDVCLTVLAACLPLHACQTDLFHTSLSLREGIRRIYDELRDEELSDEEDIVLAHCLINHDFILKLLTASSKFCSKNMSALLRKIFKNKYDES